jgi:SAM-dependent methyltransferase
MKSPIKSYGICPRDDTGTKERKTPKLREEPQNLRYIFLTSVILIVTSYYIYPCVFSSQDKRHSKMMTSRTSRYSSFAGAISEKLQNDRFWLEGDKSHWYNIELSELHNANTATHNLDDIASKFVQLEADEATKHFVLQSVDKADQLLTQMWHNLAKTVLKRFFGYTQTDINGYLRRGTMFVLSTQQYILLRQKAGLQSNLENPEGSLIDLGAGDGNPTDYLRPFYKDTYATEASWAMRDILIEKGVNVLDIDDWDVEENMQRTYDTIACLNLLDRCEEPLSILRRIRKALKPGGTLLVALVLPFNPYVEWNSNHQPLEKLLEPSPETSQDNEDSKFIFEKQIPLLVNTLQNEGFSVNAWTRVPYLCEGDMGQSLYVLSDAVFLCTLNEQ